mgnify:CR=1 FL=1
MFFAILKPNSIPRVAITIIRAPAPGKYYQSGFIYFKLIILMVMVMVMVMVWLSPLAGN